MSQKSILGYHFISPSLKLNYGDGRQIVEGETLSVEGPIELCSNGLHASVNVIDALQYAPGHVLCFVGVSGDVQIGKDKICGRNRRVLTIKDVSAELHEFAILCAERALLREREAGREPDPRSWSIIEAKRMWLREELTTEELRMKMIDLSRIIDYTIYNAVDVAYASATMVVDDTFSAAHVAANTSRVAVYAAEDFIVANNDVRHKELQWQNEMLLKLIGNFCKPPEII